MRNLLAKKPLSEQFTEAIGEIAKKSVIIILGLIIIIGRLLLRFRKQLFKTASVIVMLVAVYNALVTHVIAPEAQAAHTKPFYAPTPSVSLTVFEQHKQYILSKNHGDIVLRIWDNETTKGQNNTQDPTALHQYCKRLGKTNEFGFNPQGKQCFDTFEEAVDTVNDWFDNCLQDRTLLACLDRYSGNSKSYAERFLEQTN